MLRSPRARAGPPRWRCFPVVARPCRPLVARPTVVSGTPPHRLAHQSAPRFFRHLRHDFFSSFSRLSSAKPESGQRSRSGFCDPAERPDNARGAHPVRWFASPSPPPDGWQPRTWARRQATAPRPSASETSVRLVAGATHLRTAGFVETRGPRPLGSTRALRRGELRRKQSGRAVASA